MRAVHSGMAPDAAGRGLALTVAAGAARWRRRARAQDEEDAAVRRTAATWAPAPREEAAEEATSGRAVFSASVARGRFMRFNSEQNRNRPRWT